MRSFGVFLALILSTGHILAQQGPAIWVTDGLAKVQPNAIPGKQTSLSLAAAKNEFESFQVHVQATSAALSLSVSVSDFVNTSDQSVIAANPNVAVFREGYLNVTTPSDLNGITGQVPDQLIPVRDAYFHEARNAFPVIVAIGQTRSAWVDVFIPPSAKAGYYTASITVLNGSSTIATLPVTLKVWNFSLPSTATLKSTFGIGFGTLGFAAYGDYNGVGAYPGSGGNPMLAIDLIHAAVATFFLDHRVSLTPAVYPTKPGGQWSEFDSIYGALLNGTSPTILSGAQQSSFAYANSFNPGDAANLTDWTTHFSSKGWSPRLFGYLCDEPPGGCSWNDIATFGQSAHVTSPNTPLLVTTSIERATQNGVLNQIDILAPLVSYIQPMGAPNTRTDYDAWLQTPGKQLWWYQACGQHESCTNGVAGPADSTWASYMVDASPVRNRVFQWLAYANRIQGELYYQVDNWGDNPWDHLYFAGGNGEGAFFYPGTVDQIGGTTPVPVASIRLKLVRDGMEDYEYLNALTQAGQGSFATAQLNSFIQNAYTFNTDPSALNAARFAMGERLHQNSLDVTRSVSTTASGLTYNRATKLYAGTIKITNNGGTALTLPVQLMLNGLPAGVTLTNATATTAGGSPYITSNASLAPGTSVSIPVQFANTTGAIVSYTVEVLSGVL